MQIHWKNDGMYRIAVFGECMIELSRGPGGSLQEGFGGDTLNTAVYLARLLPSDRRDIHYVSGLGADSLSRRLLAAWEREGLRTELVRIDEKRLPGLYYVQTDQAGERTFLYWRGESAARRMMSAGHAKRLRSALQSTWLVYFSGITLAILSSKRRRRLLKLLRDFRSAGVILAFDPNYRIGLWSSRRDALSCYAEVYGMIDVIITSFADQQALVPGEDPASVCRRLIAAGAREAVVTDGAAPCTYMSGRRLDTVSMPASVQALDTTAAGDSFNAAYLAARVSGHSMRTAVIAGQALAGRVVMHRGAIMPRGQSPALADLIGDVQMTTGS